MPAKLNSLRMTRIPQTDFISATEGGYKNSRHNTIGDMHLYVVVTPLTLEKRFHGESQLCLHLVTTQA